jgi:hypothetical protein
VPLSAASEPKVLVHNSCRREIIKLNKSSTALLVNKQVIALTVLRVFRELSTRRAVHQFHEVNHDALGSALYFFGERLGELGSIVLCNPRILALSVSRVLSDLGLKLSKYSHGL